MHSTPTAALEVILMFPPLGIYIEGEATQATYRLNCSGEFTRAKFGDSEVFEKMTKEWPSLLSPRDKIVPIIAFSPLIKMQDQHHEYFLLTDFSTPILGFRLNIFALMSNFRPRLR
jgi:hypothetical protein